MTYKPDKFVVGYYNNTIYYADRDAAKAKFGFPSCQWLKQSKWTEVSAFSRHCKGVKPHRQLDANIQMKKDLGMSIEEIDNVPTSGFRIVDFATCHDGTKIVYVFDPRGFHLVLGFDWFRHMLLEHHCSISANGEISGKWVYIWSDGYFKHLVLESQIDEVVDMDDRKIDAVEKNVVKFKTKDLKVGTVYDVYSEGKEKTETERYVYVGEFMMRNPSSVRGFFDNGTHPDVIARFSSSVSDLVRRDSDCLPWNDETKAKRGLAVLRPMKTQAVFIKLIDNIYSKTNTWTQIDDPSGRAWYLDTLLGHKPGDPLFEHSIILSPGAIGYAGWSNVYFGSDITKRIVGESKDQALKVVAKGIPTERSSWKDDGIDYKRTSEYKTFPLKVLVDAVETWLDKLEVAILQRLELVPPTKPATDEEMQTWIRKMSDYKRKYDEKNRRRSWW